MVTKLQKIISKIEKRHSKKIDLSLDRTFNLLNKLGNPQNNLNNVVTPYHFKKSMWSGIYRIENNEIKDT